jgi:ribonuclease R
VKLVEAVPLAGALRFELISEGRRDSVGRRSKPDARNGRRPPPARPDRANRGRKRRR